MTTKTTSTTNNAGVPPVPPEAHQRPGEATPGQLLKALIGILLWGLIFIGAAWWMSPVFGAIAAFFLSLFFTFAVAPKMASQMVAALVRNRRR